MLKKILLLLFLLMPMVGHVAVALPAPAALVSRSVPTIMVLGDSLSAAYSIDQSAGWVSLLQQRLTARGYRYQVANVSISGETTRGGLARLPQALKTHNPAIVIVELGANDGLRGLLLGEMQANLDAIITQSRRHNAQVLLVGMYLPPNYGPSYTRKFHQVYVDLAARHRLPRVPFLLEGVATDTTMMQRDGLHPTAAAQPKVLDNVWKHLQGMLHK